MVWFGNLPPPLILPPPFIIRLFWPLKWPSLSLMPFKGPKKSRAPQKVSILCQDHLESLNWTHLVIWKNRFHNTTPHLQHRCINTVYNVYGGGVYGVLLETIFCRSFINLYLTRFRPYKIARRHPKRKT